jgi:hypothetical protein
MKLVPMHPNLPEATTALGTVVKPKQWVECAHCKKLSPLEERKWVGLTDEEILAIYDACDDWEWHVYERMLEAKLKEKNA